jgi:hypothetical protein
MSSGNKDSGSTLVAESLGRGLEISEVIQEQGEDN